MTLHDPRAVDREPRQRDRERLGVSEVGLALARGHVERYQLAADVAVPGDVVNDVGCGVGYGAACFHGVEYHGYDKPSAVSLRLDTFTPLGGEAHWHGCDLDDPTWHPVKDAAVTCCFELLEHVRDPHRVAQRIARWTSQFIVVSVPTVPTSHTNRYHLHDFTIDDVPPMFPGWEVIDVYEQPKEQSHIWLLTWR